MSSPSHQTLADFKKHAEELHQQQINPKVPTWILGIVDSYGAVHSRKAGPGAIHTDFWPVCPPKAWRYLISRKQLRVVSCAPADRADLDAEEMDAVRRHLEKQGYHLCPSSTQ